MQEMQLICHHVTKVDSLYLLCLVPWSIHLPSVFANELFEYNESGFGFAVTIAPSLIIRLVFRRI
jgi:hypothetical protein